MRIAQKHWARNTGWKSVSSNGISTEVQLALLFGDLNILKQDPRHNQTMTITTFSEGSR